MREFLIVLKFELWTMLCKKGFIISIIIVALVSFVSMSIPRFFNSDHSHVAKRDKTMLIYDQKGILANAKQIEKAFPEYTITFAKSQKEVVNKVKKNAVDAGFDVKDATNFLYYVNNSSLFDTTAQDFSDLLQKQYQASALTDLHYDASKVEAIQSTPIQSKTTVLGVDGMKNYFYTYVMIFILYFMILLYGNQIGVRVASEKSNRAMEILISSSHANALLFGKVIAGAIVGVVHTAFMVGSLLLAYQVNVDVWKHALDPFLHIPPLVLITFSLFGVLGYLLFSFLFGVIGALCSKVEDVNGAAVPIQLLIIVVFIMSFITLQNPNTVFAQVVCYVPFTSWMCMFVKVAMGGVSITGVAISLLILFATTCVVALAGAKLYRRATLSYGNTFKLRNVFQLLRQKDV